MYNSKISLGNTKIQQTPTKCRSQGAALPYIYILDARWGALKRPPSRASFRRTVVPSYRRSDVQKCRCAAIPMLRPKRRSKSEMKPKTSEELKPKTSELHSKS